MDLSDTILAFASPYALFRHAPTTTLSGVAVLGAATPLTVNGMVQPLSGRELQSLPEGMRTRELLAFFSTTEIFSQGESQDADTIEIGDSTWEVQKVEGWDTLGAYWKAIVAKIGR